MPAIHHMENKHKELCTRILGLDRSIRFAGLVDHLGSLLATAYREGLTPLASREETEKFASQAVYMTGALGVGLSSRIGKVQYVVGRYENLFRATVPVITDRYDKFYLMLSFDVGTDVVSTVEGKVIPFIESNKADLA